MNRRSRLKPSGGRPRTAGRFSEGTWWKSGDSDINPGETGEERGQEATELAGWLLPDTSALEDRLPSRSLEGKLYEARNFYCNI